MSPQDLYLRPLPQELTIKQESYKRIKRYLQTLKVLLSDIDEVHRPATAIEKSLIIKFNAEIGYCNMAMYKTGFGITKEIIDLIDKSKQDIQIYEEQGAYDISTRPILMK